MSGTVLIIEDDTRIANWVKVYFERAGFSAEVAHDGESGLDLARNLTPDLVILDLMLPRLDGVELCRILRRESDVPIIMLTAREAHAERVIGLDSGADDYIVKPFDPDSYVQQYEFEGLLFSDVGTFASLIDAPEGSVEALQEICSQFPTPEDINDNEDTAPSKRIKKLIPRYRKRRDGPELTRLMGLNAIRVECPRFDAWVTRLESLQRI